MKKAYDRVKLDFLLEVLARKAFRPIWISWIKECISTVFYSVLVNGNVLNRSDPHEGCTKVTPYHHTLFILMTDVRSRQTEKAVTVEKLISIHINRDCPVLYHLFFEDNFLFLVKGTQPNTQVFDQSFMNNIVQWSRHELEQIKSLHES